MSQKTQHLVVDSGAFIKNAAVQEYAENIYSVNGIVNEIRDKATRERLQFLPYTLQLKDPEQENIKYVTEFSKKTGDYFNLSAIDIKIIALTYELEKEYVGVDHLSKEPTCEVTGQMPESQQPFYGFYNPKDDDDEVENDEGFTENFDTPEENSASEVKLENQINNSPCNLVDKDHSLSAIQSEMSKDSKVDGSTPVSNVDDNDGSNVPTLQSELSNNEITDNSPTNLNDADNNEENEKENCDNQNDIIEKNSEDDSDFEHDEEVDEEDSWITPNNLAKVQKKMGSLGLDSESKPTVACITTDFAIQNVLLQMGLKIISVDGMLIKRAKVFILRCYACFKTTTNMTTKFCGNCGNKTLKRVSVSVNEEGARVVHINFKRPINIRGTKYSLPKPQGGKHAQNPHVCPDQPFPMNRPSKSALRKIDVLSPEYSEVVESPFTVHDVYSRAALLGFHGQPQRLNRKNPNEWGIRTGNRKKNK